MKFSIVIPCHDRLELLRKAIYTVLHQDYTEWELCIFDNASSPGIADYVKELANPKIRYERSDAFIPVTDSWNRAINMASGDYVVYLGDDDGLVPNYFRKIIAIIKQFENPEVIYSAIYQFLYPEVAPWAKEGYVSEVKNGFFFVGKKKPFLLSSDEALKAVNGSVKLRRNFTFNMQAFVFKQEFLKRLKEDGPLLRSVYPDYYIANVAFAKAKSIVIVPSAMTIVGISKASVGYTLFNGLEDKFSEILNTKLASDPMYPEVERFLLPGPLYNTHYVLTMQHVIKYVFPKLKHQVNYHCYRRIQIYQTLCKERPLIKRWINSSYWLRLSLTEKFWSLHVIALLKLEKISARFSSPVHLYLSLQAGMISFKALERKLSAGEHQCLIEVFNTLRSEL